MDVRSLRLLPVAILLASCASSAATWTFAPPTPGPTPGQRSPGPSAGPSEARSAHPSAAPSARPGSPGPSSVASPGRTRVIELDLTASLGIEEDGTRVTSLAVRVGERIHFRITNTAGFAHDFFIGPASALSTNQTDGLPGIPEFSTGTLEFDYTVTDETASLQFACSLPVHYDTMHGTFTIEP